MLNEKAPAPSLWQGAFLVVQDTSDTYTRAMASGIFYRNIRARDQLELFLLAAASSLLLVRLYLHLANYPQIGNSSLHIAHMLWGGALMMIALAIAISFIGARALRLASIVGGIGFGVFIDELGKFITSDNNYFYQPAIGIIYAIFIMLYLCFNFLSRNQPLTSREYQLNALSQLEEAVVKDMNPLEKERVQTLLNAADPKDPLTQQLQAFLDKTRTIPPPSPSRLSQISTRINNLYRTFWLRKDSSNWVRAFFVAEVAVFVAAISLSIYSNITTIFMLFGELSHSLELAIGQLVSSLVAAGFVLWGAAILPRSRLRAYEQFRRATLVNIFLTQFFMFARTELDALPGFFFNLGLLALIGYAIRQEQQLRQAS